MLDFPTDEAAIIQLRREIASKLVADSGLSFLMYIFCHNLNIKKCMTLVYMLENLSELFRACGNAWQSPGRQSDGHDDWVRLN